MLDFQDLQSSQAVDINQIFSQLVGYGFVDGGRPTEGARPFAVDVLDAKASVNGTTVSTDAQSVSMQEYSRDDKPRKAIIYIHQSGEIRTEVGQPADPQPRGKTRFDTYEPSPPDISEDEGVVIAEVWLGAGAAQVTDDDIRDRRLNARMIPRSVDVHRLDTDVLIDGSGKRLESLGEVNQSFSQEGVQEVINTDPEHGQSAHHTYFSGEHTQLSDVTTGAHHPRFEDSESVSAVVDSVDVSEFAIGDGVVPGHHLVQENNSPVWRNPPMSEAPVLDSGTFTHTGGSSTTYHVGDITPSQQAEFELGINVGVASSPGWSGDYGFAVDGIRKWNNTSEALSADIDVTWTTDPGTGNDLHLSYQIYELTPRIVSSVYGFQDSIAAIDGSAITPGTLAIGHSFSVPQYSAPGDAQSPSVGGVIVATGSSGGFGEFVYDGSQWRGPFQAGLSSLSELSIGADKSWNGHTIPNVGEPNNSTDAIRVADINAHGNTSDVHHSQTVSSDIDHSAVSNVVSDGHHPQYDDNEALEAVARRSQTMTITATSIPNNDSITSFAVVSDSEELVLDRAVFYDAQGETPEGLDLLVEDTDTDETYYTQGTTIQTDGLLRIQGPVKLRVRIQNSVGREVAAGGTVCYHLEEI